MEDILKELEQIVEDAGKALDNEYNQSQVELLIASDKRLRETIFSDHDEFVAVLCVGTVLSEEEWEESGGDLAANTVGPAYDKMKEISSDLSRAGMQPVWGLKTVDQAEAFFEERTLTCVLYEQTDYISLLLRVILNAKTTVTYMTTPNGIAILRDKKDNPLETWYVPFTNKGQDAAQVINDLLTNRQSFFAQEMCNAQIMPAKTKKEFPKLWEGLMELAKSRHTDLFNDDDTE